MDKAELRGLALRLLQEFDRLNAERFGGVLPKHKLKFSRRAVRTHGCINLTDRVIRISLPMLEQHGWDAVSNTLLHEMTHAFLHLSSQGRAHGRRFWMELESRGGSRIKYDVSPRSCYVYACPTCGLEVPRLRRIKQPWRYSCSKCDSRYNPKHKLFLKRDKGQQPV